MSAPAGWDAAAALSPAGHVLQSAAWASIRARQGWQPEFVRIGDTGAEDPARVATPVALVLWRDVPLLGRFGYCPRGPVVAPGDRDGLAGALEALAALARERGALAIKVDPELTRDEASGALGRAGYRRGPDVQPVLATLVIDLAPDEDALLGALEKDTRWSVRQAGRRGVEILTVGDDEALGHFYELYSLTGKRARFITRTRDYYLSVWRTLVDAGLATLRLAFAHDRPVAGAMTWRCGDRELYMYGATNDQGRRSYAAYALLWECITAAKARGAKMYDLGGIPLDTSRKEDPMYGPYLFKKGFGGVRRDWVGAHDTVPSALRYGAFRAAEPVYTRALRLAGRGG